MHRSISLISVFSILTSCFQPTPFEGNETDTIGASGLSTTNGSSGHTLPAGDETGPAGDETGEPLMDLDQDGVLDKQDCDNTDPFVGSHTEKPCIDATGCPGVVKCVFGQWHEQCETLPGECGCSEGEIKSTSCEKCGVQQETCENGEWIKTGACQQQQECQTGTQETLGPCERCGTFVRQCLADCRWGEPVCTNQGPCETDDKELEIEPCKGDGCIEQRQRSRTCDQSCVWGEWSMWSECKDELGCKPGTVETEEGKCGKCGIQTRSRTCKENCTWSIWSDWGMCENEGDCVPLEEASEQRKCGNCGTQTRKRSCLAECKWDNWANWTPCLEPENACQPGLEIVAQQRSCGKCGIQHAKRICKDTCQWSDLMWEGCINEVGDCVPNAKMEEKRTCCTCGGKEGNVCRKVEQKRTLTCDNSCHWQGSWPSGVCKQSCF